MSSGGCHSAHRGPYELYCDRKPESNRGPETGQGRPAAWTLCRHGQEEKAMASQPLHATVPEAVWICCSGDATSSLAALIASAACVSFLSSTIFHGYLFLAKARQVSLMEM